MCVSSVKTALKSGVRLIDTASMYGNEKEVGQAIREATNEGIIKREDVFVTTKIYPGSEITDPETSIQACLDRLNIGYVDMMLPPPGQKRCKSVQGYRAVCKGRKDSLYRSFQLVCRGFNGFFAADYDYSGISSE